jgi:hypothetical protein
MKLMNERERTKLLETVNERAKVIETGVQAVVSGYQPAMFVWGPPGLGKTRMLTTLLDALVGKGWRHHTAYATPKALILSIADQSQSIHLFEDCEAMLKIEKSAGILRAACGQVGDRNRWVTHETAHENIRINFTGGIIIATNQNLAKGTGPLQGVASRFRPLLWTMTVEERIAAILNIAEGGWVRGSTRVSPTDCMKVASTLIDMVMDTRLGVELDIRLFTEHCLPAFAHARTTGTVNSWQDTILAKLTGTVETVGEAREEKTQRLRQLALQVSMAPGNTKTRLHRWHELTGLGKAIYYRHLADAAAAERQLKNPS